MTQACVDIEQPCELSDLIHGREKWQNSLNAWSLNFDSEGERFAKEGILDIKTHIKPTNTQQYVHVSSAHLQFWLRMYFSLKSSSAVFIEGENHYASMNLTNMNVAIGVIYRSIMHIDE